MIWAAIQFLTGLLWWLIRITVCLWCFAWGLIGIRVVLMMYENGLLRCDIFSGAGL